MLENEELKQIKDAYLLLASIRRGFITPDEVDLYEKGKNLETIYNKYMQKKKKISYTHKHLFDSTQGRLEYSPL